MKIREPSFRDFISGSSPRDGRRVDVEEAKRPAARLCRIVDADPGRDADPGLPRARASENAQVSAVQKVLAARARGDAERGAELPGPREEARRRAGPALGGPQENGLGLP